MTRARGWWDGRFTNPINKPAWPYMTSPFSCWDTRSEPNWRMTRVVLLFTHKSNIPNWSPNLNPSSRRVSRTHMVTRSHLHFNPYPTHVYTHWLSFCVYTYPCKLCVHIRKYTHQHIQTLCTYTYIWTQTNTNSVCIYVTTYTPTQTLCTYT